MFTSWSVQTTKPIFDRSLPSLVTARNVLDQGSRLEAEFHGHANIIVVQLTKALGLRPIIRAPFTRHSENLAWVYKIARQNGTSSSLISVGNVSAGALAAAGRAALRGIDTGPGRCCENSSGPLPVPL